MRFATIPKPMVEKYDKLEQEYQQKNKPSINDIFADAKQRAKEHDEQRRSVPAKQHGRKSYDVEH